MKRDYRKIGALFGIFVTMISAFLSFCSEGKVVCYRVGNVVTDCIGRIETNRSNVLVPDDEQTGENLGIH